MNKCYKKMCSLIEQLQKERADNGDAQIPNSFAALFKMRQTEEVEGDEWKESQ